MSQLRRQRRIAERYLTKKYTPEQRFQIIMGNLDEIKSKKEKELLENIRTILMYRPKPYVKGLMDMIEVSEDNESESDMKNEQI